MSYTLKEIAKKLNGDLIGDGSINIHSPAKIEDAKPGTISFFSNEKYEKFLENCQASSIILSKDNQSKIKEGQNYILVDDVYASLPHLLALFDPSNDPRTGIHATAVIGENVAIGNEVYIGPYVIVEPGAVIGNGVKIIGQSFVGKSVTIGDNTLLNAGVKVYHHCVIGAHCILHSNAVIGSDGFGFAPNASGSFDKIPQVGNVLIEDHVEIGANCAIDRASMGSTVIKQGTKLDNLIHLAHNVEIGENTVMAAQAGVAGSTKLGANCMVGGQVGIVGHLTIAGKTQMQAQSGMTKSVKEENTKWYGYPAINYNNYLRSFASFKNLPSTLAEIRSLKKRLKDLEESAK